MMPIAIGGSKQLRVDAPRGTITTLNTYSVTATPTANSVAIAGSPDAEDGHKIEHGERGAAVTVSVIPVLSGRLTNLRIGAGAAENFPPQDDETGTCIINVTVSSENTND